MAHGAVGIAQKQDGAGLNLPVDTVGIVVEHYNHYHGKNSYKIK